MATEEADFSRAFRAAVEVRYLVESKRLIALDTFQDAKRALDRSIRRLGSHCQKTIVTLAKLPRAGRAAMIDKAYAHLQAIKTCDYYKAVPLHPRMRLVFMQELEDLATHSGGGFANGRPAPACAHIAHFKKTVAAMGKCFRTTEAHVNTTTSSAEAYVSLFNWQLKTEKTVWRSITAQDLLQIEQCVRLSMGGSGAFGFGVDVTNTWLMKVPGVMLQAMHDAIRAFPPPALELIPGEGVCCLCKKATCGVYRNTRSGKSCCRTCYVAMDAHMSMTSMLQGAASACPLTQKNNTTPCVMAEGDGGSGGGAE